MERLYNTSLQGASLQEESVPLKLEIVTQERRVYSADDVESVR